uniref:MIF4G_like_2 domain-containing protein n=1 Tax=Gongylonema pulchrum TaxID=637853 RepID=A0A183E2V8_9BILA
LDWKNYSGIVGLIVKGTTIQGAYETTLTLLLKCLDVIDEPAMAMPLLMLDFEAPPPLCLSVTKTLSEFLSERITETEDQSLDNPFTHLSAITVVEIHSDYGS